MKTNYDWEYELHRLKQTEEEQIAEYKQAKTLLLLWLATLSSAIIIIAIMLVWWAKI